MLTLLAVIVLTACEVPDDSNHMDLSSLSISLLRIQFVWCLMHWSVPIPIYSAWSSFQIDPCSLQFLLSVFFMPNSKGRVSQQFSGDLGKMILYRAPIQIVSKEKRMFSATDTENSFSVNESILSQKTHFLKQKTIQNLHWFKVQFLL